MIQRCEWAQSELAIAYHDREWGVPLHDDRALFELLCLEGAQAGLSWEVVLKKRVAYRRAFANFDPLAVARFDDAALAGLLQDPGLIRNRLKLASVVENARALIRLQAECGSFDIWLWRFVENRPRVNRHRTPAEVPARTELSDKLSKALRARGFKFVGSTICYAFMQASGMVNDHLVSCFRFPQLETPMGFTGASRLA
ncbi:MAG TPA: DNA-3-methyladenine glycosylase I [Candidatus Binataceae bacterium]|nr:DNA-3-methyladenine glycosylase I [Candidatus Binataceae bacterium]